MTVQELFDGLGELLAMPAPSDPLAQVGELEVLLAAESRLRALQAARLRQARDADATVEACGRSVRSWLVEEAHLGPGDAGRRVRLAVGLADLPVVFAALAAGRITAEHAGLIVSVCARVADPQLRAVVADALVELAEQFPPPLVARAVDEVLVMLGVEDAAAARERRYASRGVGLEETFGGTGSLAGTLTAEVRQLLATALAAAGPKAGPEDDRTDRQRRHDALGELAAFYLAHADTPTVHGERPRVVVTIGLDTLLDRLTNSWATLGAPGVGSLGVGTPGVGAPTVGGVGTGSGAAPLSAETARRLACDADWMPAVLGRAGEVLDIGRAGPVFPLAVRRAAWLEQSGRCAFPRCTRPPRECHHLIWWSHGGRTSLSNAAWLCRFHHWLVHEGSWQLRRDAPGRFTATGPHGTTHTTATTGGVAPQDRPPPDNRRCPASGQYPGAPDVTKPDTGAMTG